MLTCALYALLVLASVELAEAGAPGFALGAQVQSAPPGLDSYSFISTVDEFGVLYFGYNDIPVPILAAAYTAYQPQISALASLF